MKKGFLKTIGLMTAVTIMVAVAQTSASAQSKDESGQESRNSERSLEGSWNSLVTVRDCQTRVALFTFPAMQTYMHGGTMQDSAADPRRTSGHGVWDHQYGRIYSAAFQFFNFNADGTLAGRTKVSLRNTVSRSGDDFTSDARIEIYDPAGNLVATGCATGVSTRFD